MGCFCLLSGPGYQASGAGVKNKTTGQRRVKSDPLPSKDARVIFSQDPGFAAGEMRLAAKELECGDIDL